MSIDLSQYTSTTPNTRSQIADVERECGHSLPADLVGFLCSTGPGEGFIGEDYVVIHDAQELLQVNRELQVEEFAPGLFAFGSNGSGEALALDFSNLEPTIVIVPYLGMSHETALPITPTFTALLEHLSSGGSLFN